MKKMDI